MAIVRTVLPRKGFVQPQHGITQYESDMDSNMSLLDANVAFMSDWTSVVDTLVGDLGLNGVVSGFQLATFQFPLSRRDQRNPLCERFALCAHQSRSQRSARKCHLLSLLSTGELAQQLLLSFRSCRPGSG